MFPTPNYCHYCYCRPIKLLLSGNLCQKHFLKLKNIYCGNESFLLWIFFDNIENNIFLFTFIVHTRQGVTFHCNDRLTHLKSIQLVVISLHDWLSIANNYDFSAKSFEAFSAFFSTIVNDFRCNFFLLNFRTWFSVFFRFDCLKFSFVHCKSHDDNLSSFRCSSSSVRVCKNENPVNKKYQYIQKKILPIN